MKLSDGALPGVLVSVAALLLLAACGGGGSPAPGARAATTGGVPWVDTPSVPQSLAGSTAAARACAAADLDIMAGRAGAFQGQATQELTLRNRAADACFLAGAPQAQLPNAGARGSVSPSRFGNERIDLAPGQSATLLVGTPAVCAGAGQPVISTSMQLTLANGDSVAVTGTRIDTECGAPSVVAFESAGQTAAAPDPLSVLHVSMSAPATVSKATVLAYQVTVSNPASAPVALSPCPSYTEVLGTGGASAERTLLLNCQAAPSSIPAGTAITFQMKLDVPASTPAGTTKLSWKLEVAEGAVAGAAITVK